MRILRISIRKNTVAPFTGAWIEINNLVHIRAKINQSRPSRARGLKYKDIPYVCGTAGVAPFTGAWIEIFVDKK